MDRNPGQRRARDSRQRGYAADGRNDGVGHVSREAARGNGHAARGAESLRRRHGSVVRRPWRLGNLDGRGSFPPARLGAHFQAGLCGAPGVHGRERAAGDPRHAISFSAGRLRPRPRHQNVRWGIAASYGTLALIGAWWLVLFNTRATKQYFAEREPARERARPLSVSIIGWYLLICAAGTALAAVLRVPTMLFGLIVTGWSAVAVCTALVAIDIYLGAGLLRLHERARLWSIVYFSPSPPIAWSPWRVRDSCSKCNGRRRDSFPLPQPCPKWAICGCSA